MNIQLYRNLMTATQVIETAVGTPFGRCVQDNDGMAALNYGWKSQGSQLFGTKFMNGNPASGKVTPFICGKITPVVTSTQAKQLVHPIRYYVVASLYGSVSDYRCSRV